MRICNYMAKLLVMMEMITPVTRPQGYPENPITLRNRLTRLEPTRHGWTDTSDGLVRGPNLQNPTLASRVAGSILKNLIYLTRMTKPQKKRPKSGNVWASQLLSGQVWPSFNQISLNPHSDNLKFSKCSPDLLKTPVSLTLTRPNPFRSLPNLGYISIDMKEYRPNLVRFCQISAKTGEIGKPKTDRGKLEIQYDRTHLI